MCLKCKARGLMFVTDCISVQACVCLFVGVGVYVCSCACVNACMHVWLWMSKHICITYCVCVSLYAFAGDTHCRGLHLFCMCFACICAPWVIWEHCLCIITNVMPQNLITQVTCGKIKRFVKWSFALITKHLQWHLCTLTLTRPIKHCELVRPQKWVVFMDVVFCKAYCIVP